MERQYVEYTTQAVKHTVKVGLFNYPLSPTDAYIIGRIAADGAYSYNKQKKFVRMGLSAKDIPLLEKIASIYCPNTKVIDRSGRNITINNGKKDYHYVTEGHGELNFPSKFTDQLGKHGVRCSKPDRVLAGIPDSLFSSAVLGFLDGDGSIVVRHRKDCRTPRLIIHMVSGARKVLVHIQKHLERKLGIASSLIERKEKCWELRIETTETAIRFCNWVYSVKTDVFCEKKKRVFDRYMSCVRLGEFGESRVKRTIPSQATEKSVEGVETTGLPEVAQDVLCETAPNAAVNCCEDIVQI
jgi:hypothetical protein